MSITPTILMSIIIGIMFIAFVGVAVITANGEQEADGERK